MKNSIHFIFLTLVLAFLWPSRLDLLFTGVPVANKADLFALFLFILLALLSLLSWFSGFVPKVIKSKTFIAFGCVAGFLSLFLLVIKFQYPLSQGVSVCTRSPFMGDNQCLTSLEKNGRTAAWGEGENLTPWKHLFLNTLKFNYYECKESNLECVLRDKLRAGKKEPFEIEVNIPEKVVKEIKSTSIQYVGAIQVGNADWSSFSNIRREIPFTELTLSSRIRYRSFPCTEDPISKCSYVPIDSFLDTDHALLNIFDHIESSSWKIPLSCIQIFLLLFALFYTAALLLSVPEYEPASPLNHTWFFGMNAVIISCFVLFQTAGERGQPFVYLFFLLWVVVWNELFYKSLKVLIPVIFCFWFFLSCYFLPLKDALVFYHPGSDELSYASMTYDLLSGNSVFLSPKYSYMPFMVLSKPFFVQSRAVWQWVFGNGTLYFTATSHYLIGLIPFILCLALRPLIQRQIAAKKYIPLAFVFLSSYTCFFMMSIFNSHVFNRDPSNSEITAWCSGILALIYLISLRNNKQTNTFYHWVFIWSLCAFSILMRTFNVSVFLLIPAFLLLDLEWRKQRFLVPFILVFSVAVGLILLHAYPTLSAHMDSFNSYLGWQVNGWNNERPSIWWGYDRVFYHPFFKSALLLLIFLGWLRINSERVSYARFVGFILLLTAVIFAHAKISEPGGYPRHNVFFSIAVCLLSLMAMLDNPPTEKLRSVFRFLEKY